MTHYASWPLACLSKFPRPRQAHIQYRFPGTLIPSGLRFRQCAFRFLLPAEYILHQASPEPCSRAQAQYDPVRARDRRTRTVRTAARAGTGERSGQRPDGSGQRHIPTWRT